MSFLPLYILFKDFDLLICWGKYKWRIYASQRQIKIIEKQNYCSLIWNLLIKFIFYSKAIKILFNDRLSASGPEINALRSSKVDHL